MRRGMRTSGGRLWRMVTGRWGRGPRALMPPRAPLVLLRPPQPETAGRPRAARTANYRIAVHLQMSWPVWLVEMHARESRLGNGPTRAAAAMVRPAPTTGGRVGPGVAGEAAVTRHAVTSVPPKGSGGSPLAPGGRSVSATRHLTGNRLEHREGLAFLRSRVVRQGFVPRTAQPLSASGRAFVRPPRGAAASPVAAASRRLELTGGIDRSRPTAYEQPAPRTLLHPSADRTTGPSSSQPEAPMSALPARSVPAAPPIDVARLSDEVYRQIQRRVRIERERRRG